jgi:hypothetical protein
VIFAGKLFGQHQSSMGRICQYLTMRHLNTLAIMDYNTNKYWKAVKLTVFVFVSSVYPQCGQHTETVVHALMDYQSIGPFWIDAYTKRRMAAACGKLGMLFNHMENVSCSMNVIIKVWFNKEYNFFLLLIIEHHLIASEYVDDDKCIGVTNANTIHHPPFIYK